MLEQASTDGANYTATMDMVEVTELENLETNTATNIWVYGSPVLIIIGTVGNLLSAVVMLRQNLRKCTTSLYLFVLAVVDTVVLYTGLLEEWIWTLFEMDIPNTSIAGCRIYLFGFYLTIQMEAWILVCVGIERMVAVFWPHKAKQMFTRAFAARQMAIIGVILAIVNSHFYWTSTLVDGYCDYHPVYKHFIEDIFTWIDFCLASLIPFILLLVTNSTIAAKMIHGNHVRKVKLNVKNDKKLTSMTVILFSITVMFLLTTVPVVVLIFILDSTGNEEATAQYQVLWASMSLLFYTILSTSCYIVLAGHDSDGSFLECVGETPVTLEWLPQITMLVSDWRLKSPHACECWHALQC